MESFHTYTHFHSLPVCDLQNRSHHTTCIIQGENILKCAEIPDPEHEGVFLAQCEHARLALCIECWEGRGIKGMFRCFKPEFHVRSCDCQPMSFRWSCETLRLLIVSLGLVLQDYYADWKFKELEENTIQLELPYVHIGCDPNNAPDEDEEFNIPQFISLPPDPDFEKYWEEKNDPEEWRERAKKYGYKKLLYNLVIMFEQANRTIPIENFIEPIELLALLRNVEARCCHGP